MQQYTRENWIDAVKIIACILVAVGHFFQSMVPSGIILESRLYLSFIQSIYAFHVPLFFIYSGYLYQKYSCVNNASWWLKNALKKAVALGIPYFVFSFITWALKVVFSGAVNTQADGLFETLFVAPVGQYWYLYCLFLIFLITPTFQNRTIMLVWTLFSLALKLLSCIWDCGIVAVSKVMQCEIWFMLGICIANLDAVQYMRKKAVFAGGIITALVFVVYCLIQTHVWNSIESFIMGIIACCAVLIIVVYCVHTKPQVNSMIRKLSKYTMPVFLMHTIFAAALRAVLFKIGMNNAGMHIVLGLLISFIGPIIACEVMSKVKYLDFVLYPGKYIKLANVQRDKG